LILDETQTLNLGTSNESFTVIATNVEPLISVVKT